MSEPKPNAKSGAPWTYRIRQPRVIFALLNLAVWVAVLVVIL